MFFYECPKCHSGDIENNPDGSVNCPDCGYRG
jgi:DNA-directed RNA polymerase subunit RPC12/RpoP